MNTGRIAGILGSHMNIKSLARLQTASKNLSMLIRNAGSGDHQTTRVSYPEFRVVKDHVTVLPFIDITLYIDRTNPKHKMWSRCQKLTPEGGRDEMQATFEHIGSEPFDWDVVRS